MPNARLGKNTGPQRVSTLSYRVRPSNGFDFVKHISGRSCHLVVAEANRIPVNQSRKRSPE